jgi:putative ubiquitin-RnfH superfamily antitoxin RatB of RatAB toxin-antitoxin module
MISAEKLTAVTTEGEICVQLIYAWPDRYWSLDLKLPTGAKAADALSAALGSLDEAGIETADLSLAIFGRGVEGKVRLRDGDRLELLRPLLVSPQAGRAGRAAAARRASRK